MQADLGILAAIFLQAKKDYDDGVKELREARYEFYGLASVGPAPTADPCPV